MDLRTQNRERQSKEPKPDVPAEIPALIVGGGPIGLSMSLLLSYHGIRSLLVEQHPGTSTFPKARLINARTMEIFRQIGIEQAIHDEDIPHARNAIVAPSLAGQELSRRPIEKMGPEAVRKWSPTWGGTAPQDVLEPVLLGYAQRRVLARIRFSTQLASLEQHDHHVLATLVHRPSGRLQQVRAQYLIGADGGHSLVREALGIRMLGEPELTYHVNIQFEADLAPLVADRGISVCVITNPDAPGQLYYYGRNRWKFSATYDPSLGQRPEDFTRERCLQLVRMVIGDPDVAVDLGEIMPWHDSALVAERFCEDRVFLAGDSAHVMSPAGGFGMNTGIQDAHNLAWKLAAVLKGWAPTALLASYESERAPIARVMVEQMALNMRSRIAINPPGNHSSLSEPEKRTVMGRPGSGQEHGLVFGAIYDSSVIVPDGKPPVQVTNPITEYVPIAWPGRRAPHVWLQGKGGRISTLDLFGSGLVILAGSSGTEWSVASRDLAEIQGLPLKAYGIGADGDFTCSDDRWKALYDIDDDGAVLVRPDGYVAWRSRSSGSDPRGELDRAVSVALGKSPLRDGERQC